MTRQEKWNRDNKAYVSDRCRALRWQTRLKVLTHYSGGRPKCACCGERTFEFLALDHVHGAKDPRYKGLPRQAGLLDALIAKDYPKGFRVLCHNCNSSLGFYGYCPHKSESKAKLLLETFVAKGSARGERVANSKLTSKQVKMIRMLHGAKGLTFTELGKRFNVSRVAIRCIVNRTTWKS